MEENTLKLSKPLNGKQELVFDFDKITGHTLVKCTTLAKKDDPSMLVPSLSTAFQAHVAAAATGLKYDDILSLSAPDFVAVTLKVQGFLNGGAAE